MVLEFEMGIWGGLTLILGALILGVAIHLIGSVNFGYEWLVTAVAAVVGGAVASEFIVDWQKFEPVFDGLALIPALVGGLVVGIVVGVATRLISGGSYTGSLAG